MQFIFSGSFCCPSCEDNRLEEIVSGATVATEISIEDGEVIYGEQSSDSGMLERYQCVNCGYTLTDEEGDTIQSEEDLIDWLKKHKG